MPMSMPMRALLILALSALLSACGFHLRGQLPIHESLNVIAIQTQDRDLRQSLEEALNLSGATVVENAADALAVLDVHRVKFERRVRTIDDRGKVTGYVLEYRVAYRVIAADGESLKQAALVERRDFNFDPDLVLQKEIEENALREDMVVELTQRIMRQLTTITATAPVQRRVTAKPSPASPALPG